MGSDWVSEMSVGLVVTALEVRKALQESLELWLPSVLHTLADERGIDISKAPTPKSWKRLPDFRALKPDQSPAVVVASPGLAGDAVRGSDGVYSAVWNAHVFVVVRAATFDEVSDLVGLYTAAIRVAAVQHRPDSPSLKRPIWRGEGYAEIDARDARTIGAGIVQFRIPATQVVDDAAGPVVPPPPPDYETLEDPVVVKTEIAVSSL